MPMSGARIKGTVEQHTLDACVLYAYHRSRLEGARSWTVGNHLMLANTTGWVN